MHKPDIVTLLRTPRFIVHTLIAALLLIALSPTSGQADHFRVMLYGPYPPYVFSEGDNRTGISKDLCNAIGKVTNDTFEFVAAPFQRAQFLFDEGEIDLEVFCNPAWRKQSNVPGVFTIPHGKSVDIMLFGKGMKIPVKSPADLAGRTIGTVKGYIYPVYQPYFENQTINKFAGRDESQLLKMLYRGRLGQIFISKVLAQYLIKKNPQYAIFEFGPEISNRDMSIRLHPSKADAIPRFNKAIRQLLNDGTIDRIYAKYR